MLYLIFKWFHVVSIILAVGATGTYTFWFVRLANNRQSALFTLKTVKHIDDWLVYSAFSSALIAGIVMISTGLLNFGVSHWLQLGIGLFVLLMTLRIVGLSQILRKQIHYIETGNAGSEGFKAVVKRGQILGPILGAIALTIIFMMVVKPNLWP